MRPVRTLVVEDSVTVRRLLVETLRGDPEIEVVAEAADGAAAIELCRRLKPDVVTLDMMLPVMTGLAATEHIMAHCPTPILIVSASVNRGELFHTYDALAAGAVDVLDKPTGNEPTGDWEERLRRAVKIVSRVRVVTHLRGRRAPRAARTRITPESGPLDVIALGASTGGPAAIVEVLRALPAPCPLPVLLVLHIAATFGAALAEWLDGQTPHRVVVAADASALAPGVVVMAPPDRHLVLAGGRLRLRDDPERHSCRPSVDVLFESLATEMGARTAACLLTGMGRDGALGLLALRAAGAITIAQDEATSIVYGMPREAAAIGAAQHVLGLGEIGPMLGELARRRVGSER